LLLLLTLTKTPLLICRRRSSCKIFLVCIRKQEQQQQQQQKQEQQQQQESTTNVSTCHPSYHPALQVAPWHLPAELLRVAVLRPRNCSAQTSSADLARLCSTARQQSFAEGHV
jgi:hypothetical protein